MKISFILPTLIKIPIGGVKVIYRHAEELTKFGHKVTIISPKRQGNNFYHLLKADTIRIRDFLHKVEDKPYYDTPPGVEHHIISFPLEKYIPDGDVIIATGWQTAYWVASFSAQKGTKFYFLQNFETYQGNEKKIKHTWKLPLKKIVISKWLMQTAKKMDEIAYGPIPNAIDPNEFYLTSPIDNRTPQISMLYHRLPIKGSREGLIALERLKKSNQNLKAIIFTSRTPKISIPNWIKLAIRPNLEQLREIYNSTSIFLHTSHQEGWGLCPMEALACGCAVVATANEGIQEYIIHNKTGLLNPIGDVDGIIKNTQYLLDNPMERVQIARMGKERINKFSWIKSTKQLEEILAMVV
jgi:hypothetical protein